MTNVSLYHEPIAVAFAASGLFAAVWTAAVNDKMSWAKAVSLLAILSVVALHARPNVAVGLYLGTVLAVLWRFWAHRVAFVVPALLAIAVLAAGGASYLGLNALRFGDATVTHGGFDGSSVRYGSVFWGHEAEDSVRAAAFREHGRFNVLRILPNAAMYSLDVPRHGVFRGLSDALKETFDTVTGSLVSFVRVEGPRVGILFLWPIWCLLAWHGLSALRRSPAMAGLVLATAVSGGLTLAYGTITFRYRFDLWPALASLAVIGAAAVLASDTTKLTRPLVLAALVSLVLGAVSINYTGGAYDRNFREEESRFFAPWSETSCLERAAEIGLTQEQAARTCRPPPFPRNDT